MRHGDKINNLGRTKSHRKALLTNLACQLIEHKRINTTLAKAKSLRTFVEPIITRSKDDTTHNRRVVFNKLQKKSAVTELFSSISDKVANRPGGYTRIIKLPPRLGDAAEMAMIEFVDFNTIYEKGTPTDGAKKTRRSRRRGGKSTSAKKATTEAADTAKADTAVAEKAIEETTENKAVSEENSTAEVTQSEAKTPTEKADKPVSKKAKQVPSDDLTKIEGIGPKSAEALKQAGVQSFADMAGRKSEDLKKILDEAEGNFALLDPTTWPEQADLAANGKWEELKELQDKLKGGKEAK